MIKQLWYRMESISWKAIQATCSPWMRFGLIVTISGAALVELSIHRMMDTGLPLLTLIIAFALAAATIPEFRPPERVRRPTALERRVSRYMSMPGVCLWFIVGIVVVGVLDAQTGAAPYLWPAFWIVLFSSLATCGLIRLGSDRRLREHNYELCFDCEYVLSNLPEDGRCPECGRPYTIDLTRAIWRTPVRKAESPLRRKS